MQFNLNEKWAISADVNCVTISQRKIKEKGTDAGAEYFHSTWYYNNLEQALIGLIDRDVQDLEKLEDVVNRIAELKNNVKLMVKHIKLTS